MTRWSDDDRYYHESADKRWLRRRVRAAQSSYLHCTVVQYVTYVLPARVSTNRTYCQTGRCIHYGVNNLLISILKVIEKKLSSPSAPCPAVVNGPL